MKFDYYILNVYVPETDGSSQELYDKWFEQVQLAEELGYHTAWITEHHFRNFGGMLPDPQVLMGALAVRTKRIRLGTAITILPLHHPIRIAEDLAMLDNISGGRLDVGVGRGMPKLEYEVFGGVWDEAQDWLAEEVAVLRGAWTERPFSWEGQRYRYPKPFTVLPPVLQQPHPPLWMTANFDPEHFRWIGRHGLNLMTLPWLLPSFDRSRELIACWREALCDAGHDPAKHEVMAHFPAFVAPSASQARAVAEKHWQTMVQFSVGERGGEILQTLTYDAMVESHRGVFGDPAACRDHVAYVQEQLGLTHFSCTIHFGGLPQTHVLSSMRMFAEEVAPAFS